MLTDYPSNYLSNGDEVNVVAVFSYNNARYAVVKKAGSRFAHIVRVSDVSMEHALQESVPYKAQLVIPGNFGVGFGGEAPRQTAYRVVDVLATFLDFDTPVAVIVQDGKLTTVDQNQLQRVRSREEELEDVPKKVRQQPRRRQPPAQPEQARMILNQLGVFDPRASMDAVKDSIIRCVATAPKDTLPALFAYSCELEPTSLVRDFVDFDTSWGSAILDRLQDELKRLNRTALAAYMETLDVNDVARVFSRVLRGMRTEDANRLRQCVRYSVDVNPSFVVGQRIGEWEDEDDLSWLSNIDDE